MEWWHIPAAWAAGVLPAAFWVGRAARKAATPAPGFLTAGIVLLWPLALTALMVAGVYWLGKGEFRRGPRDGDT
jgi:hypothetical protein